MLEGKWESSWTGGRVGLVYGFSIARLVAVSNRVWFWEALLDISYALAWEFFVVVRN
jgi:hypothetical protein